MSVQINNLPLNGMTFETSKQIDNVIGVVEEVDVDKEKIG